MPTAQDALPPADTSAPALLAAAEPPWLAVARGELGVCTAGPGACHPRIAGYHATTALRGRDDKVAWCSSFVQWCLDQVGIAGTGSGLARSWLGWGLALEAPRPGCIAVLSREDPAGWKGHVGFFLREEAGRLHLLGGNQLDAVREHDYPAGTLLGWRWPTGWP
ncbi:TIGR02594 family protein [Piscinibacter sakaiensis]|uniref:Cell wall-associated hydrolase n=1 Tax=Piscinibacter sakaiensis TaxID=1547922 RepID=A0A0K8NVM0_PISS1|nr:TIGR02594 family protein [Piscinibacter sakaiensis]GAP34441.1 cell wall-associated hydrolase [Piscinibacter sakaiensis]